MDLSRCQRPSREGNCAAAAAARRLRDIILAHSDSLYFFLRRGEWSPDRAAKHLGWYCGLLDEPAADSPGSEMGAESTADSSAHALKHFEEWVSEAAVAA